MPCTLLRNNKPSTFIKTEIKCQLQLIVYIQVSSHVRGFMVSVDFCLEILVCEFGIRLLT